MYPFNFEFIISYELMDKTVKITKKINNLSNEKLYFSIGSHPSFRCSLDSYESYENSYLYFDEIETVNTLTVKKNGLLNNEKLKVLDNTHILNLLSTTFDNDALILENLKSKKVSLINNNEGKLVTVDFGDFPYLAIWTIPSAPFICIEPWYGLPDFDDISETNLELKKGNKMINEDESFQVSYHITLN